MEGTRSQVQAMQVPAGWAYLIDISGRFGTCLKKANPKFISQGLAFAEGDFPLGLIHVRLISHKHLPRNMQLEIASFIS